ncbi:MAG: hypothetical protein PCFJNLEI_04066 [Verrucomicrobiae bacterium]|nr:hypothetical protein [Verrucomicrobiae bacterium]
MQAVLETYPPVAVKSRAPIWFERRRENVSCAGLLTLVLWVTCLAVGLCGLVFPYARPRAKAAPVETIKTEKLVVELTDEPLVVGGSQSAGSMGMSAPADAALPAPAPAAVAVALASPDIAFPIPVQGPVEIVDVARAGYSGAAPSNAPGAMIGGVPGGTGTGVAGVQTLTFGHGDGRQPAPDYPRVALRAGQEGTVQVRMLVGTDGRVMTAEAQESSAWPLLDEAAVHCVRQRWRFRPGALRSYEVAIRFQIRK